MGKKTNGTANDNASRPTKESAAPAKKAANKASTAKPVRKKVLAVTKAAAAGAAIAMAAGEAIAKIAGNSRTKRTTTPRTRTRKAEPRPITPSRPTSYSREEIALRAYFISERRRADGAHGNPEQDWIEAERQLAAECR